MRESNSGVKYESYCTECGKMHYGIVSQCRKCCSRACRKIPRNLQPRFNNTIRTIQTVSRAVATV